MKLVVGLGNPGEKYALTRHNVGFRVLDALAKRHGIDTDTVKRKSRIGKGLILESRVVIAKPQTYMNLSGVAVKELVRFFKVDAADVIVVHDDLDLQLDDIRIKVGGSDGGHKGLSSVMYHLEGSDFIRVRLGIGRPAEREMIEDYVLARFSEGELKVLPHIISRACDAVEETLSAGVQAAMNKFNVRVTKNSSKEVGA